jgi:hypothetical protein
LEIEAISRTVSPSSNKSYGVARVVALWNLPRSSVYAARHRERRLREAQKRGPKVHSDADDFDTLKWPLSIIWSGPL